MPNLGLNEALLIVNRGNVTGNLELFHQLEECFGCALTPLKPLDDEATKFVVDTKHDIKLELRQSGLNSTDPVCRLYALDLNSQGQYRIDVSQKESTLIECELKTLDYGECLLCPFAILICFLFALMAAEQAYTKFWLVKRNKRRNAQKSSSQSEPKPGGDQLGDDADDEATTTPENSDGSVVQQPAQPLRQQPSSNRPSTSKASVTVDFSAATESHSHNGQPLSSGLNRIECLDVFRGLTLAGMIFVNYGGAGYAIWDHKPWDGLTLADFVFPFFIFSMGASIAISVRAMVKRHRQAFRIIATKILKRSLILFLLGIFLNSKAVNYEQSDGLMYLRLTGVLQRFSISYLVIAFMYTIELVISKWTHAQSLSHVPYLSKLVGVIFEILTAINYTAIYVYITFYLDYDSSGKCPAGYTGPGGQTAGGQYARCTGGSAAWLDRLLLGENHLYNDHEVKQNFKTQVTHDPEGILGYTTSIVLTLIGLQCGKILAGKRTPSLKLLSLAKWILLLALSCSLVVFIPINKRLWSLTFVVVTALAAYVVIVALYVLTDIYTCKRALLVRLLSSAGKNSLFLYVAHSLIYGLLPWWFPLDDPTSHMQLLFRLTWATLVWLLVAHYMAKKKLFIRI